MGSKKPRPGRGSRTRPPREVFRALFTATTPIPKSVVHAHMKDKKRGKGLHIDVNIQEYFKQKEKMN
ncbi:hypothetical protein GCK72_020981 [Caenorhabditis remanei]|uniref:Uncharacterized protein n=1 Tax=Caenorhabditis remanei TaxID=31234 RepID=A0A6A5GGX3_CAERE|nr:hypothetical protein GCK72_020981 [Caenorhabditis remanei]KAF1754420.1 hypothetical protein GCK72_020981 [Caenorhabditis remanei]